MLNKDRPARRKRIIVKPKDPKDDEDLDDFIFKDEEETGASER